MSLLHTRRASQNWNVWDVELTSQRQSRRCNQAVTFWFQFHRVQYWYQSKVPIWSIPCGIHEVKDLKEIWSTTPVFIIYLRGLSDSKELVVRLLVATQHLSIVNIPWTVFPHVFIFTISIDCVTRFCSSPVSATFKTIPTHLCRATPIGLCRRTAARVCISVWETFRMSNPSPCGRSPWSKSVCNILQWLRATGFLQHSLGESPCCKPYVRRIGELALLNTRRKWSHRRFRNPSHSFNAKRKVKFPFLESTHVHTIIELHEGTWWYVHLSKCMWRGEHTESEPKW